MAKNPITTDAKSVFAHAEAFFLTLDHLHTKSTKETIGHLLLPIGVLTAFACEIMLKCLVIIDTGSAPPIHGLFDLFDKLKPHTKESLIGAWAKVAASRSEALNEIDKALGTKRPRDLESNLKSANDAFTQLRYVYEGGKDFDFRLSDFPIVLREQIRAQKPELFS